MTRTRKTLAAVAVAVLVGFAGTSAGLAATDATSAVHDTTAVAAQETTPADNATMQGNESNVTFDNQTSNGTAVVVNSTVLPEGGFVVVHLANATNATDATEMGNATEMQNLTAGAVIGNSTYLEPGTHENVTVALNESAEAVPLDESQFLIAMNHRDTNDNQQYDFPEADGPYVRNGNPVTDPAFVTLAEAGNETVGMGNETTVES